MTARQTFERDLPILLEDLYLAGTPTYRDDIVRATASVRQRPGWTFPERWIPMDFAMRLAPAGRLPMRTAATLLVVALLVVALAVAAWVGTRQRLAPPLGPAGNGPLAYSSGGDIFSRDGLTGEARLLIGGPTNDAYPGHSGDGGRFLFERTIGEDRFLMMANADGSGIRQVLPDPIRDQYVAWSIDGRYLAITEETRPTRTLYVVAVDSSEVTKIDLGRLRPTDVAWRPPHDRELLVRVATPDGTHDLVVVGRDGSGLRRFNLPSPMFFGADWELTGATWDPAGDRIAYNRIEVDPLTGITHYRIHVMNADGTGDITLPGPESSIHEAWPQFSPDGRFILAQRFTFEPSTSWLAVTPADASGPGRDIGPRRAGPGEPGDAMRQLWSPDGSQVLLRYNADDFWSIDPLTGDYQPVLWPAAEDIPDWRRVAP